MQSPSSSSGAAVTSPARYVDVSFNALTQSGSAVRALALAATLQYDVQYDGTDAAASINILAAQIWILNFGCISVRVKE